eukprot:gb/GFBE01080631.1/.p1 GENE.gb/GFBE01080631.1/~~gb/GFBE01080631.1/.p1  ORF type:complete len:400 (+),score=65.97 gb/GFBE01080631.1/:1-1200(+)
MSFAGLSFAAVSSPSSPSPSGALKDRVQSVHRVQQESSIAGAGFLRSAWQVQQSAFLALGATAAALHRRARGQARKAKGRSAAAAAQDAKTLPLNKLDELLEAAVNAEANGDSWQDVAKVETAAKEFVQFAGNGFRFFGAGTQVEKRPYTPQELDAAGLNTAVLLNVEDTLENVRRTLLIAFLFIAAVLIVVLGPPLRVVNTIGGAVLVGVLVDQLVNQGTLQILLLDSVAGAVSPDYRDRVAQHEAGRFLVAYLIGILPKGYTLSAADALGKFQSTNIRAGCVFCTAQVQQEMESGTLSGTSLDRFVCVKLAGIVQEYLLYRQAQIGGSNLQQVENLFQAMNFEQRRSGDQTRFAVLNVATLLRGYEEVHSTLAEAMKRGASVAECIAIIERGPPEAE